ncbi:mCG60674, isoform CRA_b, partial [Mus musculus]
SQSYPFSHSLGWSLSSGCSQAPIRVEGTIYSATEPVDTVLSQYILHIKFLEYFKIRTNQNTKSLSCSICATTTEHHTLDRF